MKLTTIVDDGGGLAVGVARGDGLVVLPGGAWSSVRAIAAGGAATLAAIDEWLDEGPPGPARTLEHVTFAPAVPDPGAIYTIGHNYGPASVRDEDRPARPLIYGKAAAAVGGHRAELAWDREVTDNVDAEVELAVVMGREARDVAPEDAMNHVFGYTCVNDISSRDPWLDGDQWLIGKSLPGFCPIGPWVVTADALDPADLRLSCTINGQAIQEGRTSRMRFRIPELIAYLSRHLTLRPGDLIVTGTPERLETPPGPDRRLRAGDEVTASIEGIGALTTSIR